MLTKGVDVLSTVEMGVGVNVEIYLALERKKWVTCLEETCHPEKKILRWGGRKSLLN